MSENPISRPILWGLTVFLLLIGAGSFLKLREDSPVPAAETNREPLPRPGQQAPVRPAEAPVAAADVPQVPPTATVDSKPYAIRADRDLPHDFLEQVVVGNSVAFTLPDGNAAAGTVEMIERDHQGILFVQGRLSTPHPGFYFFQRQTAPGVAGPFVGHVRFDGKEDAWKIEPTGNLGAARLNPSPIDNIVCINYAKVPEEVAAGETENAPQTHPNPIPIPSYQTIIPLQSLPGATAVIYLDFDGEQGPFPGWGDFDASPANANNNQIYDVWKMVSEDFQGFSLNVTTDRKIFDNTAEGRRVHCIVTPTTTAAPGAGGVAYVGSFNWTGDRVCWAFYSTGKSSCEVISHEVGHTLGLSHDGRISPSEGYYGGHGTDPTGWAPIMGVGYYKKLSQWSKGEYLSANQTQDDLTIIDGNNDVNYRTDDGGDTLATARYLEIAANNSVSSEGIIERTGDIDSFRFATTGGTATLTVNPVSLNPNIDLLAEIVNASTSTVVVTANPDLDITATVTSNLPAGEYLLRIRGTGRGDPLADGYTNYGSIGAYLVSGSVVGGIKSERFSVAENSPNTTAVGTVIPRNNHAGATLDYAIASGNTGNAFAINPLTGAITVADSTKLNYETLSLRWDDPATYELFVTINNPLNPALNESLRTVITVTNLNENPTVTGGSVNILEHTIPGTSVFKVTGSDVDRFDFPTFSISAGNTGNAFSIDGGTGQIQVAADIDVAANTNYTLTVLATDQGTPGLTATASVVVTVINTTAGYQPGRIVRTFFDNISGSAVTNLTSNAKFPNNPDSEEYLTSFDGLEHGDNFGSTIRGYLIPPATGNYQFWIASDDASQLRLSTSSNPANATSRATVSGYTNPYAWTANASQQSATIALTAGVPYYIEARHKEGGGGDHLAVAWTGPGFARQVISGLYLAPFYQNYAPKITASTFAVRENALPGQTAGTVAVTDVNAQDTFGTYAITGGNTGNAFSINPATGVISVATAGVLNATSKPTYTLTIQVTDNGTPALSGSGNVTINITPAGTITVSGIAREIWTGINGTALTGLTGNANYPYKPNTRQTLTSFASAANYADNYGSRIRAKFIPPATGSYQFYLASDDDSRLLFSANESGAGATQIANIAGWSNEGEWTKFASQTSAVQNLTAGQAVYLETLQKEGGGGDHVSVGYTGPDTATITVIPGSMLQPVDINAPPVFTPTTFSFNLNGATAVVGTSVGTARANEPNAEPVVHAILSGNTAGAFAMHPTTGVITVANPVVLTNGVASLQVAAQDGGLSGAYPFASATATVNITVSGINTAPTFSSNPFTRANATEDQPYSQTLAGTATDANAGDTLTFSKISGPSWLSVASNGALGGTPLEANNGANSFVVRVTDAGGLFAQATLNINVTPVNEPPSFVTDPVTGSTLAGNLFSTTVSATDPDTGDTRSFSKVSGPAWLAVASNGVLSGTATVSDAGLNAFVIRVTDSGGLTDEATVDLTVVATPTWINASGGSWNTPANWLGGIIGNGSGSTIDFTTLNPTTSPVVTLDGGKTAGHLSFADTTPSNDWTVSQGSSGVLTLATPSGTPSITVVNRSTTLLAAITGTQGLTKLGAGTLAIHGSNTVSGGLMVNEGTVKLAGTNTGLSQAGSGTLTINPGAVVEAHSHNALGQAGGAALSPLVIHGGSFLADAYNQLNSITLEAGIIGVREGVSQVDGLSMNTRNSLPPSINSLAADTPSTISSVITLADDTTFSVLNGSAAEDLTVSGMVVGTGTLTKTGPGTLTLTAANTYTGITTISEGTLALNGSLAATSTTVATAATLAGTGSSAGPLENLGTLSPGIEGIGTLATSGSLTLAADSDFVCQITDWNGIAGTGWDSITSGDLQITATPANPVTIHLSSLALTNFSEASKSFPLITFTGVLSGFDPAAFVIDSSEFTTGAGTWSIQQVPGQIVLAYTRSNTAPGFTAPPLVIAAIEDQPFTGSLTAIDPDAGESLTFTKTSGPEWLTVSSNGDLGGTPENGDVGITSLGVTVTDSFNVTGSAVLEVQVANTNDAPVFTLGLIDGPNGIPDTAYTSTIAGSATDVDLGDSLVYSKVSGPTWLIIAPDGSMSGTPLAGDSGTNSFIIRATDSGGLETETTLRIEVETVVPDANGNGISDVWETEKFGSANPGENPADEDADHDGLVNLMEFALGSHPLQSNASPIISELATIGPDQFLQLTIPKNPDAADLIFVVEVCSDLENGSWSADSTVTVSESASELIVRDSLPLQGNERRFIRLRVQSQE